MTIDASRVDGMATPISPLSQSFHGRRTPAAHLLKSTEEHGERQEYNMQDVRVLRLEADVLHRKGQRHVDGLHDDTENMRGL